MESTKFEFKAEKISKKKLQKIWDTITHKPFPHGMIRAFILPNEEMFRVLETLKKSPNIKNVTVPEYGEELGIDDKTDASVFVETRSDDKKGWIIIIKKEGYFTIEENIRHELEHIAKGNIGLDESAFGSKI